MLNPRSRYAPALSATLNWVAWFCSPPFQLPPALRERLTRLGKGDTGPLAAGGVRSRRLVPTHFGGNPFTRHDLLHTISSRQN